MNKILEIVNESEFDDIIQSSKEPVLVYFSAPWCGPCKVLSTKMEGIASQLDQSGKVLKINIDNNVNIANQFGILSVPSLLVFKNGEIQESIRSYDPDIIVNTVKKYS